MDDTEIRNATIDGTSLGFDHHYSFWIHLSYGESTGQGFGGYALGGKFTDYVLRGILSTIQDGGTWETLKGKPCRAKIEDGKIIAIGHYLDDKWFTPSEYKKDA